MGARIQIRQFSDQVLALGRVSLLCAGLVVGQVGCQSQQVAPSPTPLASATTAPVAVEPTPGAVTTSPAPVAAELDLEDIRARYEEPFKQEDNGYPAVSELMVKLDPVSDLSVDTPEQQESFDKTVLPVLLESFSKPYFLAPRELAGVEVQVDYRGLRHLVGLLTTRADQLWNSGERERALRIGLQPLHLAKAMRARPETVSVNLFSAWYAESSLRLIPGWLSPELSSAEQALISTHLSETSPRFAHLQDTVKVDFAKLLLAMGSEEGRSQLGIGTIEPRTSSLWMSQLQAIYGMAHDLYSANGGDPAAFNAEVLKAATPIQGLVIDYPEVSTMQKRSFALYKATELGLALLGPGGDEMRKLSSDELIAKQFSGSPDSVEALKQLIKVEITDNAILVKGLEEPFKLLAPGEEPVFFEYHRGE